MMFKHKIPVALLLLILGCTSFDKEKCKNNRENVEELQEKQVFELDKRGDTVELINNKEENLIVVQTKRNGRIISTAGFGNSNFLKGNKDLVNIESLLFTKNDSVFVIKAYIKGSTYGAERYFLVFKKTEWLVTLLPFDRAKFIDVDKDGFDEIVEYRTPNDSIVYSFKSGLIIPK